MTSVDWFFIGALSTMGVGGLIAGIVGVVSARIDATYAKDVAERALEKADAASNAVWDMRTEQLGGIRPIKKR